MCLYLIKHHFGVTEQSTKPQTAPVGLHSGQQPGVTLCVIPYVHWFAAVSRYGRVKVQMSTGILSGGQHFSSPAHFNRKALWRFIAFHLNLGCFGLKCLLI